MNRRELFGSLGTLFGCCALGATATPTKPKSEQLPLGRWSDEVALKTELCKFAKEAARLAEDRRSVRGTYNARSYMEQIQNLLERPSCEHKLYDLVYRVAFQKKATGTAIIWAVPNLLGKPMELYSVPTALAIPQPAFPPDFPYGYYRILPQFGEWNSPPSMKGIGIAIPARWMIKVDGPEPKTPAEFCEQLSEALTKQLAPMFGEGITIKVG